jgi:hypothetical protein
MTEKLFVGVTFDPEKGYVGAHPDLRAPVVALSLSGLRRKIEIALLPDDGIVVLNLDRAARLDATGGGSRGGRVRGSGTVRIRTFDSGRMTLLKSDDEAAN